MIEPKHTEGPWQATVYRHPDGTLDGPAYIYAPLGPDLERSRVCQVYDNGCVDANAHLIAAAPDLLDAAKQALRLANDWPNDLGHKAAAFKLEAAIEKAEGS